MPESIRSLVGRTLTGYKLGGYAEATISSALIEREREVADAAIALAESRYVEGSMFREIFDQVGIRCTDPEHGRDTSGDEPAVESSSPAMRIAALLTEHGVEVSNAYITSDGEVKITGKLVPMVDSNGVQSVKPEPRPVWERVEQLTERVRTIEARLDNPTISL
ncbi:hypothetical protein FDH86_gp074 [Arthrobacter phage Tank]|uniref:Uncharacterized protein n=1 Tax=Arthrobacter phage Tank TaxID=1772319 RepID=A0A0U4JQI5_9CAUD|nr:hypothetical protein FDH86_gp074 [Arthrobacter phage Tank]ALY10609.1 hypothetical protein TANK_74 [Arthrobacter phage Tank]